MHALGPQDVLQAEKWPPSKGCWQRHAVHQICWSHPARLGRLKCSASCSDAASDEASESEAGTTPRPCVYHRRSEWFHHSVAWNAVRSLGVKKSHMPTAMLGAKKRVLPNARLNAGESSDGVSSGTAVCAIHATDSKACVSCGSRKCQIEAEAKCMQSSNAVKTMAARRSKNEKEGSDPQGMSLTKGLKQKRQRGRRFNQD